MNKVSKRSMRLARPVAAAMAVSCLAIAAAKLSAEPVVDIPQPVIDAEKSRGAEQVAVLSGGCFWGVQGVFSHVKGVREVISGYAGGARSTAQYEEVATGATGHAESVQIRFDPALISYGEILQVFFSVAHDPTQLNRQGPDVGTQYRSEIFTVNEEQQNIARRYVAQLDAAHVYSKRIVTQVEPLRAFYPAEDYHQDFLLLHPQHPYIVFNDLPKVEHLKATFPSLYRDTPVRLAAR